MRQILVCHDDVEIAEFTLNSQRCCFDPLDQSFSMWEDLMRVWGRPLVLLFAAQVFADNAAAQQKEKPHDRLDQSLLRSTTEEGLQKYGSIQKELQFTRKDEARLGLGRRFANPSALYSYLNSNAEDPTWAQLEGARNYRQ